MPGKSNLLPIDSEKFEKLCKSWGGYTVAASKIYRTHPVLSKAVKRGTISRPIADAIETVFGVPYTVYKKEDDEATPQPMVKLPQIDNDGLKELAAILREMNNTMVACYKRLNHITGILTRLEDSIKDE